MTHARQKFRRQQKSVASDEAVVAFFSVVCHINAVVVDQYGFDQIFEGSRWDEFAALLAYIYIYSYHDSYA